jgi:hypothetical protein
VTVFGRRSKKNGVTPVDERAPLGDPGGERDASTDEDGPETGPWDSSEVGPPTEGEGRLDLGSVRVPMPEGGQVQVEMETSGSVRSVHLVTADGRITVAAFAAPRSPGQWREVAAELSQGLRADQAQVTVEDGPWGREVLGIGPGGAMRFLGVDGPRWMVRCVASGPASTVAALAVTAREVLADTVVVRGDEPLPVRTTLPVTLPAVLVQQLDAARAQAAEQAAMSAADQQTGDPDGGSSAMQQAEGVAPGPQ